MATIAIITGFPPVSSSTITSILLFLLQLLLVFFFLNSTRKQHSRLSNQFLFAAILILISQAYQEYQENQKYQKYQEYQEYHSPSYFTGIPGVPGVPGVPGEPEVAGVPSSFISQGWLALHISTSFSHVQETTPFFQEEQTNQI